MVQYKKGGFLRRLFPLALFCFGLLALFSTKAQAGYSLTCHTSPDEGYEDKTYYILDSNKSRADSCKYQVSRQGCNFDGGGNCHWDGSIRGPAALCGIVLMRAVTGAERISVRVPLALRPAVGGVILATLAMATPQVLSAGHGALQVDLAAGLGLAALLALIAAKAAASIVSLSFGFRGGLFFASLFLGALLGQVFAQVVGLIPGLHLDHAVAALIGMGALGVAVVGGPFTMSFLVLEATGGGVRAGTREDGGSGLCMTVVLPSPLAMSAA